MNPVVELSKQVGVSPGVLRRVIKGKISERQKVRAKKIGNLDRGMTFNGTPRNRVTDRKLWTEEEDSHIIAGLPYKEVGRITGRSIAAVQSRRHTLRAKGVIDEPILPKRGNAWHPWEDALVLAGVSTSEISRRTGRTLKAIWSRRTVLGAPPLRETYPDWTPEEDKLLRESPLNAGQLAKVMNRTTSAIRQRRHKLREMQA